MHSGPTRPRASATDRFAVYVHGLHQVLALIDGIGAAEVPAQHLPLPAGAKPGGRLHAGNGDPFSDPHRPLRISLGNDVAQLPRRDRAVLAGLARLDGVEVHALPGAIDGEPKGVGVVTVEPRGEYIDVKTTLHPSTTYGGFFGTGWHQVLDSQLRVGLDRAFTLTRDIAAHEALGNDYLVSPILATRRATAAFWGAAVGSATLEEATFLAGVKTRMYRMMLTNALSQAHVSVNTGWVLDAAALALAPRLKRALAGALSPVATRAEGLATPHLLAIRGLLRDLLLARDELARLERREAMGPEWPRTFGRDRPIEGGSGNDLIYRMSYHATAALNAFTAILDNLAWVVSAREGIVAKPHTIGFDRLVAANPGAAWQATRPIAHLRAATDRSATRRAMAIRALRNWADHRDGLEFGAVRAVKYERTMKGPEMLAIWVWKNEATFKLWDGTEGRAADQLDDIAALDLGDVLLLRPRPLVEACIASASRLTNDFLSLYDWSPADWIKTQRRPGDGLSTTRLLRGRWQRALWGVELAPRALLHTVLQEARWAP